MKNYETNYTKEILMQITNEVIDEFYNNISDGKTETLPTVKEVVAIVEHEINHRPFVEIDGNMCKINLENITVTDEIVKELVDYIKTELQQLKEEL